MQARRRQQQQHASKAFLGGPCGTRRSSHPVGCDGMGMSAAPSALHDACRLRPGSTHKLWPGMPHAPVSLHAPYTAPIYLRCPLLQALLVGMPTSCTHCLPATPADDLRKEAQQKQKHARSESDRILQEERAKDAAWRQAAIKQAPSVVQLRQAYEAQWQALQERMGAPAPAAAAAAAAGAAGPAAGALQLVAAGAGSITYADVPWLVPDLSDKEQFEAVVLHGVEGPADVKRRLRSELLRWHPDKFVARFGARVAAGDRDRVLAGVQHTSQMLTSMVAK
jgi:hypothetical protein